MSAKANGVLITMDQGEDVHRSDNTPINLDGGSDDPVQETQQQGTEDHT